MVFGVPLLLYPFNVGRVIKVAEISGAFYLFNMSGFGTTEPTAGINH